MVRNVCGSECGLYVWFGKFTGCEVINGQVTCNIRWIEYEIRGISLLHPIRLMFIELLA